MQLVITSKKPVLTATLGRLPRDVPIEVDAALAKHLLEHGLAIPYEVKRALDVPSLAAGAEEPLSASPAAQASPQTTSSESASGAKKRGRPKKEA